MVIRLREWPVFLCLLISGCTPQALTRQDVIGRWLNEEKAELVFAADGTFQGKNSPSASFWSHEFGARLFAGAGTWELPTDQAAGEMSLRFTSSSLPTLENGFSTQVLFERDDNRWRLYQRRDQEGGDRVEFHK